MDVYGSGTNTMGNSTYSFCNYVAEKYNMTMTNKATPGTTLAIRKDFIGTDHRSILERVREMKGSYDVILLDGGFNDQRSQVEDYRKTNRGGKGVKTFSITEKTGRLVAIKNVTDENDLMIINKSGIAIRLAVSDCRVMGRATQGVRLINLSKKNDVIASVCKVMSSELEAKLADDQNTTGEQDSDAVQPVADNAQNTDSTEQAITTEQE